MGTPELACVSLRELLSASELEVVAVVTQPDRPKGRELKLRPSPVKQAASSAGIPVLQPEKARAPEFLAQLRTLCPELIAVAAFGQILPPALLALPRFGCINVHTSLLPRYRGAAPIQWAILNDDKQTGVTIMKMDAGLDTGDILSQETTPVLPQDTAESLHNRLAQMGAELLVKTIPSYISGEISPHPQPSDGVTLAPKIKKQDGQLDWNQSARTLWNRVRGLVPWPGAFTFVQVHGARHLLKVWQASVVDVGGNAGTIIQADAQGVLVGCGQQALRIECLQLEGGRRLSAQQFLAGHDIKPGDRLGGGA